MAEILEKLRLLWTNVQADERLFWLTVGALLFIVLVLLILVRSATRKRRRRRGASDDGATTFVPVNADRDTESIFLPLSDKLIAESTQRETVSGELLHKIRQQKPESLSDILLAINKCTGPYRDDLRRLIGVEQMLLIYARGLGQANFQPYTLAAAWHECPDPAALPAFVELLASREEEVQMAAVRLLIALNEPQSLTYLASALLQPHRYVPARVAEVLVAMGESAAWLLAYLLPEIPSDSKPLVLSVLGQMRPGYPLEQVLACLNDSNEQTRRAAVAALGEGNTLAALNEITALATDQAWEVRAAVAKALGQIGEPASLPVLQQLAEDEIWMVAVNAQEALRHMQARQKIG